MHSKTTQYSKASQNAPKIQSPTKTRTKNKTQNPAKTRTINKSAHKRKINKMRSFATTDRGELIASHSSDCPIVGAIELHFTKLLGQLDIPGKYGLPAIGNSKQIDLLKHLSQL